MSGPEQSTTPGATDRRKVLAGIGGAAFVAPRLVSGGLVPGFASAGTGTPGPNPTTTTTLAPRTDCIVEEYTFAGAFTHSAEDFARGDDYYNHVEIQVGDLTFELEIGFNIAHGAGGDPDTFSGALTARFRPTQGNSDEVVERCRLIGDTVQSTEMNYDSTTSYSFTIQIECCPLGPGGCTTVGLWQVTDCDTDLDDLQLVSRSGSFDVSTSPTLDRVSSAGSPYVRQVAETVFGALEPSTIVGDYELRIPTRGRYCPDRGQLEWGDIEPGTLSIDPQVVAGTDFLQPFVDAVTADGSTFEWTTSIPPSSIYVEFEFTTTAPDGSSATNNAGAQVNDGPDITLGPFYSLASTAGLGDYCVVEECDEFPCTECVPQPQPPAQTITVQSLATVAINRRIGGYYNLTRPDGTQEQQNFLGVTFEPITTVVAFDSVDIMVEFVGTIDCVAT